jgi:hypothetical protein
VEHVVGPHHGEIPEQDRRRADDEPDGVLLTRIAASAPEIAQRMRQELIALEPSAAVQVRTLEPGNEHKYTLTAGAHRFYCSLAVGFTAVPAVQGFDWSTLDR